MECNGRLNQPLKKLLLWPIRLPPNVFPCLMCIKEVMLVKELNAATISDHIHAQILSDPRHQTKDAEPPWPNHSATRRYKVHRGTSEARLKPCGA